MQRDQKKGNVQAKNHMAKKISKRKPRLRKTMMCRDKFEILGIDTQI